MVAGAGVKVVKPNKSILVADDNADLADGFSVMLELEGFDVETVYSGQAAVNKLDENRFDLAFIDIKMPDLSGIKVLKACNKKIKTKIVLMTGYRIEQVISEIYDKRPVRVCRVSNDELPEIVGTDEFKTHDVLMLVGDADRLRMSVQKYCLDNNSLFMIGDAVHALTENNINTDVLLLNLSGSLINSVILLDEIKDKVSDLTRIILLVDMQDEKMKFESINSYEVAGCLFKPVDPEMVLNIISKLSVA